MTFYLFPLKEHQNMCLDPNEYLKQRLSGKRVISSATIYGKAALTQTSDDFFVVDINPQELSYLCYAVSDEKFHVTRHEYGIPHTFSSIISDDLRLEESIRKWWKNVFYEHDGVCTYDNFYDSLKIAEGSESTFRELIDKLTDAFQSLNFPSITSQIFLTGEMAEIPLLRYVFQQLAAGHDVRALPSLPKSNDIDEKDIVTRPVENLESFVLNVGGGMKFTMIASNPATITLPILSSSSEMFAGTQWNEMLVDQQKDYSVGNFDFKLVNVSVEYDVFQNIFLSCVDTRGNRKVKLIK